MARINADDAIEYGTMLVNAGNAAKKCGLADFDLAESARADVQSALDDWAAAKAEKKAEGKAGE